MRCVGALVIVPAFACGFYLAVAALLAVMALCAGTDERGWWLVPLFWPIFICWIAIEMVFE